MTTLREAAQQALEALTNCSSKYGHRCNRCDSEVDEGGAVAAAIRGALAQQDEPVLVQGELPPRYVARSPIQAEPLNLTDPAVQKRLAAQWGYVHEAQQAEPVEPVATLTAQRDALLGALNDIANTDHVDAALDPQRAVRIARAAIKAVEEGK